MYVPRTSRASQSHVALNLIQAQPACDHMSGLPQHSICTDSRNSADELEGRLCCMLPTGELSPRPLVSSLTGSGLRSLFLAVVISRESIQRRHPRGA
jgi:hypothetical protein